MDDFLTKPIVPNLLFATLSKWLSQRAADGRTAQVRTVNPAAPAAAMPATPARRATDVMPAAPAGEPPLFDLTVLGQTFGNKADKMRKYALMFLDSARDSLAEVDEALGRGDSKRLAELGHRIKSSARAVGAMSFAELCLALERLKPDAPPQEAQAIVSHMHLMLERLKTQIAGEMSAQLP